MKSKSTIFIYLILIIISFGLFTCDEPPTSPSFSPTPTPTLIPLPTPAPTPVPTPTPIHSAGDVIIEKTGIVNFNIRYAPAGLYYVGENPPSSNNVTLTKGYWITETEVTYELWYEVKSWADLNGYDFVNLGVEGHDGTPGFIPTDSKNEPVTFINWRDCIIWCNALSEKMQYTPIYYSDPEYTIPIKISANSTELNVTAGSYDNPYVYWNANGYRLPTEVEWEIAARGSTPAISEETYGTIYSGSDNIDDVAWYTVNSNNSTHIVGTKIENELVLYDMSGNVGELCWDWYGNTYPSNVVDPIGAPLGSTIIHISRGGSWNSDASLGSVSHRQSSYGPYSKSLDLGFRILRN